MNNREWATLIWLITLLGFGLSKVGFRSVVGSLLRILASSKILLPLILLSIYSLALVLIGHELGLWNSSLVVGTVEWFVGTALVLFFNLNKTWEERSFFGRTALRTIEVTVIVTFVLNIAVFSLPVELVLQPILATLLMLPVAAARDPAHQSVKKFAEAMSALAGFVVSAFTIIKIVQNWRGFDPGGLALDFALPIWMTLGILPLIHVLGLMIAYESAFLRVDFAVEDEWPRRRAKVALVTVIKGRVQRLQGFGGYWAREAGSAPSFRAARRSIKDFLKSREDREAEAREATDRLERYAGVRGVDSDERQLDRREFAETTSALRWLATCQMGWYRNRGGRYRSEMLEVLSNDFTRQGLPENHGISLHVSHDGKKWWAWRRAITRWCFAIGASGPPPNQWEFDGPEPPSGFPGEDSAWGDEPFSIEANRNW